MDGILRILLAGEDRKRWEGVCSFWQLLWLCPSNRLVSFKRIATHVSYAETAMNGRSSRAHTVFVATLRQTNHARRVTQENQCQIVSDHVVCSRPCERVNIDCRDPLPLAPSRLTCTQRRRWT